ncbi:hypothetical protein C2E23DRAFT_730893 [Lenzites betulinus]|nr:hypothetical protein C2E23DRAFT_730893 [Lenzites betulinus]
MPSLCPVPRTIAPADPSSLASHRWAAKMFSLASCVMLFFDIAITFGDEVEKIWKQRFTGATVLWFLNRYLSPLGYIVIIVSFHDPSWSKDTCQRYVLFPEVLKVFTATAIGLIFILRLYSIYSKNTIVLYGFTLLLIAELAVKIWSFTDGTMLHLPPDTAVFFATLYRTIELYRLTVIGQAQSLITIIMRDGIMYFAAIFVSNLVTVLIYVPDLKVINASFSTLITSLMVSRLMLNLRSEVLRRGPVMGSGARYVPHSSVEGSRELAVGAETSAMTFESTIIGNLGAPIMTFEQPAHEDEYDLYADADEKYDDEKHDADHTAKRASGSADEEQAPSLPEYRRNEESGRPDFADDASPRRSDEFVSRTRSPPNQFVVEIMEEVIVETHSIAGPSRAASMRRPLPCPPTPPIEVLHAPTPLYPSRTPRSADATPQLPSTGNPSARAPSRGSWDAPPSWMSPSQSHSRNRSADGDS